METSEQFIPEISHICCMDEFELIGVNSELPWKIPEELEYFKAITNNSIIIMGNNTYKSLNREYLPNRINLVVSKSEEEKDSANLYFRKDLESLLVLAGVLALKDQKNIFIIGGASIYKQTFDIISKVYLTVIHHDIAKDFESAAEEVSFTYYEFTSIEKKLRLLQSGILLTGSFDHPVHTFVFEVKDDPRA